jgi:hypothetical protein
MPFQIQLKRNMFSDSTLAFTPERDLHITKRASRFEEFPLFGSQIQNSFPALIAKGAMVWNFPGC